ncbi:MAG: hypothetical protein DHS80DRAFT_18865 [Piptocephalis tieghemiana]|nr:MAG: hypothetical protein DHS80DRAFT_18865 [Piptocephalis tieghemiana]
MARVTTRGRPLPSSRRSFSTSPSFSSSSPLSSTQPCVLTSLRERGLVSDVTSPDFAKVLAKAPLTGYVGVDPTAASLHVGHLVPFLTLLRLTMAGHHGIALIGGATGSIGDPSGRNSERKVLDQQVLEDNIHALSLQLKRFFHQGQVYAGKRLHALGLEQVPQGTITIRDNREWFQPMSALQFLGSIGRHARIGPMLARESVKSRMSSSHGLSFTEFSYQLLQAYDFYHLYQTSHCRFQLGGSDQWGNITAGTELISKMTSPSSNSSPLKEGGGEAYGLTTPLLTTSKGEKFGKSAGNAIWLDPHLTPVFEFYQYFIRIADDDVRSLLLRLTMLPLDEIDRVMHQHHSAPEARIAQRCLAREMTELIHSENEADRVEWMSKVLYDPMVATTQANKLIQAFTGDDRLRRLSRSEAMGKSIQALLVSLNLAKSKTAARKLIQAGGVYINGSKVTSLEQLMGPTHLLQDKVSVLRTGKANNIILELI